MCLALWREWEGEFRRHADGTDGMDTGEYSAIYFSRCLLFVITEVYSTKEQGHAESTEMDVLIQVGSGYGICFLLMHLSALV